MARINQYLHAALALRASDIHFASGEPVRARVDGDLIQLDFPSLEARELQEILFEILTDPEKQKFLANKNIDKSYVLEGVGFFRVNIFMTRKGISSVLRAIPQRIPSPDELGLPRSLTTLADVEKGLILVTGPTGSGKSTTLAALIGHINKNYKYHILTAEDPVEFVHSSELSLINQREIGANCPTFEDALKYALREDPDVILVGEMRDLETISLALTAAETGHLVFGTLHTRGAAASIDRIIDSFPANQQAMIRTMLAESLVAVVSQALLKRADRKGRIAAYEIMVVNHAISNLIREGKSFQIPSIIQTARKEGMVLMDQYIAELVERGLVTAEEAEFYVEDTSIIKARAKLAEGKQSIAHQVPVFTAFNKPKGAAPVAKPAPKAAAQPPAMKPAPVAVAKPAPAPAPVPVPEAAPVAVAPPPPPPPPPPEPKAPPTQLAETVVARITPPPPPPPPKAATPPPSAAQNSFRSSPPPAPKSAAVTSAPQPVLTDLTEDTGTKNGEEFMDDLEGYSRIIEVGTVMDAEGNITGKKVNNVLTNLTSSKLPTPPPLPKKKAG